MEDKFQNQYVVQNLLDAGFNTEEVNRFLDFQKEGDYFEQVRMLSAQREHLLERVHKKEKQITCLDYLVRRIKKVKGEIK